MPTSGSSQETPIPRKFKKGRIRIWPLDDITNNLGKKASNFDEQQIQSFKDNYHTSASGSLPESFVFHPSTFLKPSQPEFSPIFQKVFFGTVVCNDGTLAGDILHFSYKKQNNSTPIHASSPSLAATNDEDDNIKQYILTMVATTTGTLHKPGVVVGGGSQFKNSHFNQSNFSRNQPFNMKPKPLQLIPKHLISVLLPRFHFKTKISSVYVANCLTIPPTGSSGVPSLLHCKFYLEQLNSYSYLLCKLKASLNKALPHVTNYAEFLQHLSNDIHTIIKFRDEANNYDKRLEVVKDAYSKIEEHISTATSSLREMNNKKSLLEDELHTLIMNSQSNTTKAQKNNSFQDLSYNVLLKTKNQKEDDSPNNSTNSTSSLQELLKTAESRRTFLTSELKTVQKRQNKLDAELSQLLEEAEGDEDVLTELNSDIKKLQ